MNCGTEMFEKIARLRLLILASFDEIQKHKRYYITSGQWGLAFNGRTVSARRLACVSPDVVLPCCCALSCVLIEAEVGDNRISIGSDTEESYVSYNLRMSAGELEEFLSGYDDCPHDTDVKVSQPWRALGEEVRQDAINRKIFIDTWGSDHASNHA